MGLNHSPKIVTDDLLFSLDFDNVKNCESALGLSLVSSTSYSSNDTAVTSAVITLPSGIVAGNLLLIFFIKSNVTDDITPPSGWTELAVATPNGSDLAKIYAKIATDAEGATQTISWTSSRSEERRVGKECRFRWRPYH